jgi:hypothetical protein
MNSIAGLVPAWNAQDIIATWRLVPVLLATYALVIAARGGWRRTLGKAQHVKRNLRRLAPYVRHEFIKSLFDEPAWAHKARVSEGDDHIEMTVRTWPLGRMGYLVTWCNPDDEVVMYSVTTRSRWLRPRMDIGRDGRHRVTLGKTRLAALPDPGQQFPAVGARRYAYAETHYFGNRGGYQHWAVGVCDAAGSGHAPVGLDNGDEGWDAERMAAYRSSAVINSVLVSAMSNIPISRILPYGVGPDLDRVRLMDPLPSKFAQWRWNRKLARLDSEAERRTIP